MKSVWRLSAWYWTVVAMLFALLPLWVLYINRENGFSNGDQIGFVVSLLPGLLGLALAYGLRHLLRMAEHDPGSAGEWGEQLGISMTLVSVLIMLGSLFARFVPLFLLSFPALLVPAGIFAGASGELRRRHNQ